MRHKILFGFCMAAMAVGLLAGCKKDGIVKLGIRTEGVGGAKGYLDVDNTPKWQNGESIYLNNTYREVFVDDNEVYIEGIEGVEVYRAVYPASIVACGSDISSSASVSVILPQEQEYIFDRAINGQRIDIPMGAYLNSGNMLRFKNLCSLVKVSVTNSQGFDLNVTSISLKALDNGVKLSGAGAANIDGTDDCSIVMSSDASDSVIITNCGDIWNGDSKDFYIVVPPFSANSRIRIIVTATDYIDTYTLINTTPSAVTVGRNDIATTSITMTNMQPDGPEFPENPVFTVGVYGKKVSFSPGNLYWDGSSFHFEEHQWEYQPHAGEYTSGSWNSSHVSHFYWSDDPLVAVAENYDEEENEPSAELFTEVDGFTVEGNSGWRTLTDDEWEYLLSRRNGARFARAKVLLDDATWFYGLLIFPDDFRWHSSMGTQPSYNTGGEYFSGNVYSTTQFAVMQAAGVVFLPTAGYRNDTNVEGILTNGDYWTSTRHGVSFGDVVSFSAYNVTDAWGFAGSFDNIGHSIRLVRDVSNEE